MTLNITSVLEFMPLDQSHFMQGICLANGSTINDTMQFFKAEITKQQPTKLPNTSLPNHK